MYSFSNVEIAVKKNLKGAYRELVREQTNVTETRIFDLGKKKVLCNLEVSWTVRLEFQWKN